MCKQVSLVNKFRPFDLFIFLVLSQNLYSGTSKRNILFNQWPTKAWFKNQATKEKPTKFINSRIVTGRSKRVGFHASNIIDVDQL